MKAYQKFGKRIIDVILSISFLVFIWPIFLVIAFLTKIDSPGAIFFCQKRIGKGGKIFTLYKFRSMVENAEQIKKNYLHLNEANGPVFKIKNDPRYTKLGKFLSHTGLDELPQLFNILKGEMTLVGPRPLPVDEEEKIPKKWLAKRREAKPGIASSWFLKGAHELSFEQWMELDIEDIEKSSFIYDLRILLQTTFHVLKLIKNNLKNSLLSQ